MEQRGGIANGMADMQQSWVCSPLSWVKSLQLFGYEIYLNVMDVLTACIVS